MMIGASITRNSLLLGLFTVITTAVIAGTMLQTRDTIEENIRLAEERALVAIVPRDVHNNSMLDDFIAIDEDNNLGLRKPAKIYIARMDGEMVGVIIPATARDGYTGDIDLIVGVRVDGTVAGVRVLSHRETPGLGDKVDYLKSDWVDGFIGKSLDNPLPEQWKVKRDGGIFDQFTGATVTPRAVTRMVMEALEYFDHHRDSILSAPNRQAAQVNNNG